MGPPIRDQRFEPTRGIFAGRASDPSPRSSGPREECNAPGCPSATNGGKPYCLEHIDLMPYVIAMEKRRPDP